MKINKYLILFLWLCSSALKIAAQQKQFDFKDSLMLDREKKKSADTVFENNILGDTLIDIHAISISRDTLIFWKNKKEFAYQKNLDSLLRNLKNKFSNTGDKKNIVKTISFFDRLFNASFLKGFLWLLAALFTGFILYNLFLSEGTFKKNVKDKNTTDQVSEEDVFLHEDYDALLHQAYKLQDFRLATRYLFLKTLQRLNNKSLIDYAADKTNSKYANEIPAHKRNEFASLVMNYEYVWYGNISISRELFDKIEIRFSSFLNKI